MEAKSARSEWLMRNKVILITLRKLYLNQEKDRARKMQMKSILGRLQEEQKALVDQDQSLGSLAKNQDLLTQHYEQKYEKPKPSKSIAPNAKCVAWYKRNRQALNERKNHQSLQPQDRKKPNFAALLCDPNVNIEITKESQEPAIQLSLNDEQKPGLQVTGQQQILPIKLSLTSEARDRVNAFMNTLRKNIESSKSKEENPSTKPREEAKPGDATSCKEHEEKCPKSKKDEKQPTANMTAAHPKMDSLNGLRRYGGINTKEQEKHTISTTATKDDFLKALRKNAEKSKRSEQARKPLRPNW